jgi:hypothetical protein
MSYAALFAVFAFCSVDLRSMSRGKDKQAEDQRRDSVLAAADN